MYEKKMCFGIWCISLTCCCLSLYRYRLSGQVMPMLRDWMMATVGISLDHKTPAQVEKLEKLYLECFLIFDHANHPI